MPIQRRLGSESLKTLDRVRMPLGVKQQCKPLCVFTGLCAEEVHLCGESAAIDLVTELLYTTGEEVEVRDCGRLS